MPKTPPRSRTTIGEPAPGTGMGRGRPVQGARGKARQHVRTRRVTPDARRRAILAAALAVFSESGFDAARLDDVAKRAGVAKGTLYLYFEHKEALFEELVRGLISPVMQQAAQIADNQQLPALQIFERVFALFESEVLQT